jgi:hypothetical protein
MSLDAYKIGVNVDLICDYKHPKSFTFDIIYHKSHFGTRGSKIEGGIVSQYAGLTSLLDMKYDIRYHTDLRYIISHKG